MKALRTASAFRLLVAVAMMLSWFVLTNHCALGLMKPTEETAKEHAACHSHKDGPDKGPPTDGTRECCRAVHASLPAKVEVKFDASKFQLQLFAIVQVLVTRLAQPAPAVFIFDHGPPRSLSFAESVLQHSLLGHAPPLV